MTMYNYEENMKIFLAEENPNNLCIRENFETLTNQDIIALKVIYDFEFVNTHMIYHFLKDKLIDYSFKNRLKKYIHMGFIKSYYILSQNGERTSNIHILTNRTAELIEEYYSLGPGNRTIQVIPTDKDILYILTKLALNQFLMGGKEIIRKFEIVNDKLFNSLIYYENSQVEFYVKVIRFNKNNFEEMKETIQYVDTMHNKNKKVIFIFEDLSHMEEVTGEYLLPKYRKDILFKTDSMVFDFPELFIAVDYPNKNNKNEKIYTAIKIRNFI